MDYSVSGFPVCHQLPEPTQTHVHRIGDDAIQPSHPLSSPSPPTFNPSQHQGLFRWVLYIRWPKYWSFSFNISPFSEYSGLISFRKDWLDLLSVQWDSRIFFNTTVQKHQVVFIQFCIIKSLKWKFSIGRKFSHCILIIVRIIFLIICSWIINYPTPSGLSQ